MEFKDLSHENQSLMTEKEFDALNDLQSYFIHSTNNLQNFFQDRDQENSLNQIVHNWLGDNKKVQSELKLANKILERIKERNKN